MKYQAIVKLLKRRDFSRDTDQMLEKTPDCVTPTLSKYSELF